jgi:hypothetical protein
MRLSALFSGGLNVCSARIFVYDVQNLYQDMSSSEYESDIFMVNPSAKYIFYFQYLMILVCFPVT